MNRYLFLLIFLSFLSIVIIQASSTPNKRNPNSIEIDASWSDKAGSNDSIDEDRGNEDWEIWSGPGWYNSYWYGSEADYWTNRRNRPQGGGEE